MATPTVKVTVQTPVVVTPSTPGNTDGVVDVTLRISGLANDQSAVAAFTGLSGTLVSSGYWGAVAFGITLYGSMQKSK